MWVRGLKPAVTGAFPMAESVAPRVGAWIETLFVGIKLLKFELSHPVWVRGLKLEIWITSFFTRLSHPVWVRGLKHRSSRGEEKFL